MARGRPPGEIDGKYPNRLREYREKAGLDIKDVAAALNVSRTQASRLERGISLLNHHQRVILAKLLNVEPWYFYGDGPDPRTQALLEVFRKLSAERQELLIATGNSFAEPARPYVAERKPRRGSAAEVDHRALAEKKTRSD